MKRHPFVVGNAGFVVLVVSVVAFFGLQFDILYDAATGNTADERKDLKALFVAAPLLVAALFAYGWLRLRDANRQSAGRDDAERRAHAAARHDALTGLPNRRMFHEQAGAALGAAWQTNTKCAVFYIDLDGFKPVNDTYGHAAGDTVLIAVAARLKHAAGDGACVARLGGDEFAVLTAGHTGIDEAALIARRLLRELQKPFEIDGGTARIGATVGVALGPDHGQRADDLITAADRAMYDGKRNGKAQVRVYEAA